MTSYVSATDNRDCHVRVRDGGNAIRTRVLLSGQRRVAARSRSCERRCIDVIREVQCVSGRHGEMLIAVGPCCCAHTCAHGGGAAQSELARALRLEKPQMNVDIRSRLDSKGKRQGKVRWWWWWWWYASRR